MSAKYERFGDGTEVIENTGLTHNVCGELLPVFKYVNPVPGRAKNQIIYFLSVS